MTPCPHCGKPTRGTVDGDVTHATCPSCTEEATGKRHLPRQRTVTRPSPVLPTATPVVPEKPDQP